MKKWQLQTAKAHFSELIRDAATDGPQYITVRNVTTAVVISKHQFDDLTKPKSSFVEFMRKSPFVGSQIDLTRQQTLTRGTEEL